MSPKITLTYSGGVLFISGGVLVDGGGIIIAGGKVIHVPPWTGPLFEKEAIQLYKTIVAGAKEMEGLFLASSR